MARENAAATRESRPAALLSIGQVLARLTPDFPDLSPSKLRFLEEQGLVTPARTDSGYRKFCHADMERLRLILTMQREHYLPLKVIRGYLAELDAGKTPTLPGGGTPVTTGILQTSVRRSREELLRESGATPALLQDAVSASFIVPADAYGEESLTVLRALVELQRCGIEPRHLRAFRGAIERELGLIESAVAPLGHRKGASRARAEEAGREIATQLETVRASLIRSALGGGRG